MAVQGPFTLFNIPKKKILGGGGSVNLLTDTFKAALCTSAQALAATFAGASTDARYADLTGELTTAAGYTAGGLTLTSPTLVDTAGVVSWDFADAVWTLTGGGITFKYFVIYDFTTTNKDLIAFCDMDTGGGSVSPTAGALTVAITNVGTFT